MPDERRRSPHITEEPLPPAPYTEAAAAKRYNIPHHLPGGRFALRSRMRQRTPAERRRDRHGAITKDIQLRSRR